MITFEWRGGGMRTVMLVALLCAASGTEVGAQANEGRRTGVEPEVQGVAQAIAISDGPELDGRLSEAFVRSSSFGSKNRSDSEVAGDHARPADLLNSIRSDGNNYLVVKATYWLPW
jgi:hypothetical protein